MSLAGSFPCENGIDPKGSIRSTLLVEKMILALILYGTILTIRVVQKQKELPYESLSPTIQAGNYTEGYTSGR